MTTILSYGGGVNSTALLLEWLRRGNTLDALIFADPGSEMPETYDYIEQYVKPFCKEQDIPFEVTRYSTKEGLQPSLYEQQFKNRVVPSVRFRSCTSKFKIVPIEKYLKEHYPNASQLIGIDYGERHRAKIFTDPETGKEEYLYPNLSYPLIEWKMTRDDCAVVIEAYGWPAPVKSGCYFCPFQNRESWRNLYETHPELYKKAEALEINAQRFPEFSLMLSKPGRLDWFRRALETQTTLDTFTDSEEAASIPCMCYDG